MVSTAVKSVITKAPRQYMLQARNEALEHAECTAAYLHLICHFPGSFCFHLQDLSRPINMRTTGKGGRGRGVESSKASPSFAKEMASREGKRSEGVGWQVGREAQEKPLSSTASLLQQPPNSPQVPEP